MYYSPDTARQAAAGKPMKWGDGTGNKNSLGAGAQPRGRGSVETELEKNSLGTKAPRKKYQLRPLQMKFLSLQGARSVETELE